MQKERIKATVRSRNKANLVYSFAIVCSRAILNTEYLGRKPNTEVFPVSPLSSIFSLKLIAKGDMAAEKRTIGLAMDYSPSSKAAVKWAVDNLVKSGDRIILIHVLPKGADASHKELWKSTGSPLIPLLEFMEMNVQARYGVNPDKEVLEILQAESKSKQVEVLAKIYWGDAREKLCEAVDDLKADSVVLGCRGLGPLKRALLGSVSNYVVNNATCPVTVVRGPTGSNA